MKSSVQLFSILIATIMLSGCPIIISHEHHSCNMAVNDDVANDNVCHNQNQSIDETATDETTTELTANKNFMPTTNYQTIGEYTEQLVAVLIDKSTKHDFDRPIAVPPFMFLATEETYSQRLAVEIPENIIASFRDQHVVVAEYRLTPPLPDDTLPYEDIMDSLVDSQKFGYVLKGTIRNNPHGVTVFVKIIELDTQGVIASASKHIPQYMLSHREHTAP